MFSLLYSVCQKIEIIKEEQNHPFFQSFEVMQEVYCRHLCNFDRFHRAHGGAIWHTIIAGEVLYSVLLTHKLLILHA